MFLLTICVSFQESASACHRIDTKDQEVGPRVLVPVLSQLAFVPLPSLAFFLFFLQNEEVTHFKTSYNSKI